MGEGIAVMTVTRAQQPSLHILVVDDDPDSRFLCKRILERLGHRVDVAEEGLEAIGRLRDGSWDVVLTDQNMPGATGLEVLERARRLQPDSLRLLMSAVLDPGVVEKAEASGDVHAFIKKPLERGPFEYAGRAVMVVDAAGPSRPSAEG